MSPSKSDDLTELIEKEGEEFVVLCSSVGAEDSPDYQELGRFATHEEAANFLATARHDTDLASL